MYGTTRQFLDYFNLKTLAELPSLSEIRDIDEITRDLFEGQIPGEITAEEGVDAAAEVLDSDGVDDGEGRVTDGPVAVAEVIRPGS